MEFDLDSYKQFLIGRSLVRVCLNGLDITNFLIEALLVFDKPITSSIKITVAKQTLYKKYKLLFDLSNKPKGAYLNHWMLYQYGYKFCNTCNSVKNITEFGVDTATTYGLNIRSKTCSNRNSSLWKKNNRNIVNNYQKIYYYKNIEYMREKSRLYQKTHKDVANAASSKKRAIKLQAAPKWLTENQLKDIKEFYFCAKQLELETGIRYHVDHIIPLQGKTVCGLHVPWNLQVIPAIENIKKSNKHFEDYSYWA